MLAERQIQCADCVSDVDHCHDSLLRHADGSLKCTGANCLDLASVRHALSIDCAELQGGCGCVDATRGELLAS